MFDSKTFSADTSGEAKVGGRKSNVAKSPFSALLERFIATVNKNGARHVGGLPLPKAGVAPEGLHLSAEVWFYL